MSNEHTINDLAESVCLKDGQPTRQETKKDRQGE